MSQERPPDGRGGEADGNGAEAAPPAPDEGSMGAPGLDSLFELLADARRRRVLSYLAATDDGVATFSELADHVVGADADERERLAIQLHHIHLPKLEDAGVVEYDARSETVRYRGSPAVADWVDYVRR